MLDEQMRKSILDLQKLYPKRRSALIPALHLVQSQIGFLPPEAQKEVAELFEIDVTEVRSIVSFYDMFFEKPVGKHLFHVCKNVSCMLRGADELLQGLCKRLCVQPGEVSADGECTVIASECLGACDQAPMIIADEKVYGTVAAKDLDNIIFETKKELGHPSPMRLSEVENE